MAQLVRTAECHSVGHEYFPPGGDETQSRFSSPMAPSLEHEEELPDLSHHGKKSVLAKVKEKAKKLKHSLSRKRHGHDADHEHEQSTPPWGVALDEDEEFDNPYYHGAPMYESELVPEPYRDPPVERKPAPPPPALNRRAEHCLQNRSVTLGETMAADKNGTLLLPPRTLTKCVSDISATRANETPAAESKTLTRTVTGLLAPAYAMVSDATHKIASTIQATADAVSPSGGPKAGQNGERTAAEIAWDKGISVTEYLKQKLEPGPEEKVLSQVISEAMSPMKGGDERELGVVDKVKEAVTCLWTTEELSSSVYDHPAGTHPTLQPPDNLRNPMRGDFNPIKRRCPTQ